MTLEPKWREALLRAVERDYEVRARLVREGTLFDGYHPEMEAVHLRNATLLEEVLDAIGWPGRARLGDDGAAAAFIVLQHAISRPDLQRRGLAMMLEAIPRGEASMMDAAYLSDRIAVFEGRPQLYGTQFDWFGGELAPAPIAEPDEVDARRAAVGLPPLAEVAASLRQRASDEGDGPPPDIDARRAGFDAWAKRVGWR